MFSGQHADSIGSDNSWVDGHEHPLTIVVHPLLCKQSLVRAVSLYVTCQYSDQPVSQLKIITLSGYAMSHHNDDHYTN